MTVGEYIEKMQEQRAELYYQSMTYKGRSLLFWALEWFRMSNDCFCDMYGFNFNPHEYPGLYELARKKVYPNE